MRVVVPGFFVFQRRFEDGASIPELSTNMRNGSRPHIRRDAEKQK